MLYNVNMGDEVSDAARADLCIVFETNGYFFRDEAGREWPKEQITEWLSAAEDIRWRMRFLPRGLTAFIFQDHFYKSLFVIHFGITFNWD